MDAFRKTPGAFRYRSSLCWPPRECTRCFSGRHLIFFLISDRYRSLPISHGDWRSALYPCYVKWMRCHYSLVIGVVLTESMQCLASLCPWTCIKSLLRYMYALSLLSGYRCHDDRVNAELGEFMCWDVHCIPITLKVRVVITLWL